MNIRLKKFCYILTVVLVLCFTSVASAEWFHQDLEKGQKAREEKFDNIAKELNLSPEQQQQIANQRSKEKEQAQELRQKITAKRSELSSELDKQAPDRAKVYALISEMKELIGKRMEQRAEGVLLLKQILTPEQFKALNEKTKPFQFKKEAGHEKTSHNGTYYRKSGYRCNCQEFCQRLG
jgi:Spy/CpxP family protein refolding chaperone